MLRFTFEILLIFYNARQGQAPEIVLFHNHYCGLRQAEFENIFVIEFYGSLKRYISFLLAS